MPNATKVIAFEYVVYQLLKWHSSKALNPKDNDFSILKTLKLLFFVTAARSNVNVHSILLEDTFSNFVAMPYGHVESDVYNSILITSGDLKYYKIDNRRTTEKNPHLTANIEAEIGLSEEIKHEIIASVEYLKQQNPNLVLLSPFELVNLSHTWYSWKTVFTKAKKNAQRSMPIPAEMIKGEYKLYSI